MSLFPEIPEVPTAAVVAFLAVLWFLGMLVVLVFTGRWSFQIAAATALTIGGALASLIADEARDGFQELTRSVRGLEIVRPWWLVLLAVVPGVTLVARHNLRGLGPFRKWFAISLRSCVVLLLIVALAEPRARQTTENVAVVFVIDRSLSVPPDPDPQRRDSSGEPIDRRWERVKRFVDESVRLRGVDRREDRAGVVLFGRTPRLVSPPATVDELVVDERRAGSLDGEYTDIAAAMKLAFAAFPEGMGRRIVLVSDGNENLGRATEQARLAKQQGVQIDVLPLAVGYRNTNEVLVQEVEAPPATAPGQRLPVRVLVRNAHPTRPVVGTLELVQLRGREQPRFVRYKGTPPGQQPGPVVVTAQPGLNGFEFLDLPTDNAVDADSFVYRAAFTPRDLPGDRVSNNLAATTVLARGQRRLLLLEDPNTAGSHSLLLDTLRAAKFRIDTLTADRLPPATELGEFLSTYDSLLLADVPSEIFTPAQMEAIRRQTVEQGMGLIAIGGPNSFGLGGYRNTPIEAALPVSCEIPAAVVSLKGGLVLIMEGSEWKKRLAREAVERLGPSDMVGVLNYASQPSWYIPFQPAGVDRGRLCRLIDRMRPGDMPNLDPYLKLTGETLADPTHKLAVKHYAILSEGELNYGAVGKAAIARMTENGITGTNYFPVRDPRELPRIYTRETRQVSRSFLMTGTFTPTLLAASGPAAGLQSPLPPLHGFVRTTLKPGALPVMAIEGPPAEETRFPIVAYWQSGAGRAIAFTSDAGTWARDWAQTPTFARFWTQAAAWSLRSAETGQVSLASEVRDGRIRIVADVRDDQDKPLSGVSVQAFVSVPRPGEAPPSLTLNRAGPGRFEGSFAAADAGAYFVNVRVQRNSRDIDGRRIGVTIPHSPEFDDLEPNPALLRHLAELTGGEVYSEDSLAESARAGTVFRPAAETTRAILPFWASLILVAGVLLVVDVAVRRIAFDVREFWATATAEWHRLRTRFSVEPESVGLDRLLQVKQTTAAAIDEAKLVRREEAIPPPRNPVADEEGSPTPPPQPPALSEEPATSDDYLSRLSKAKRRTRPDDENA